MTAPKYLKKISENALSYIFPRFCVGCGIEGTWLCNVCEGDILEVKSQVCPQCGRLSESGFYCQKCRFDVILVSQKGKKKPKKIYRRKPLQGIITAFYFEEGPMKEMIHNFKYNSVLEFKDIFSKEMAVKIKKSQFDIITFTPLHPKRFSQRGYNQAEVLAKEVSSKTKIPCQNLLLKTRNTKRQVGLIGQKRRKNLKDVFRARKGIDISKKRIIIVDDVTTTGTTLNECARVLKTAGAKEIWGLVIARG